MKEVKRYSGVIVKCGDEVLLCKRNATGELPGQWSIPCGHLEKGEHPMDGVKREFKEETNYTLDNDLKLVGFVKRYNRDGTEIKGLMYVFMMETDEPINPDLESAKDGEEHTECGYFNLENLPFDNKSDQLCKLIMRLLKKD
jgi:ADP-ribose pyrophosphatase YjhB (NUDIX family)